MNVSVEVIETGLQPTLNQRQKDILGEVFHLRYRVFYQKLDWEVPINGEQERDHFDDLNPAYIVSYDPRGRVSGALRLLPTTGPYMLKDVFPQLLEGEEAPQEKNIWEVSRFAVAPCGSDPQQQATASEDTVRIILEGLLWGKKCGVDHFLFVTSVAVERLLKRIGMQMRRWGSGKATRIGKVLTVACWLDVTDAHIDAMLDALGEQPLAREAI